MGEMFSTQEWLAFGGLMVVIIGAMVFGACVWQQLEELIRDRKNANDKNENKQAPDQNEMFYETSDIVEFNELAENALEQQRLLEFKCTMEGIEKAIRIIKGDN
jgi:uncharacterized membrane protein YcjF (UPF0283 family)